MKSALVWLPVAFVLGGLVGRFGPAEELRAFRRSAEAKETAKAVRSANGFDSFAALANIPKAAKRPHRVTPSKSTDATAKAGADNAAAAVTNAAPPAERRPRRMDPEDLRARIDEAAELWRTRIELKRAATVEKLGLNERGAAVFDETIAAMNARLRDTMQAMADQLAVEGAEMTPELGVRFLGDLSAAVAETYDALGEAVGEEKRGEISRLQLHEFVDPSSAEPLIAVQDRLDMSALSRGERK